MKEHVVQKMKTNKSKEVDTTGENKLQFESCLYFNNHLCY